MPQLNQSANLQGLTFAYMALHLIVFPQSNEQIPQVSIQVDSNFNRPQFDYAISEIVTYHATERLSFYLVNENISNLKSTYDQDASGSVANLSSAGVGITYRIVDMLFVGIHASLDLNAECRDFYERDHSSIQDSIGCGGGVMINAKY